jgi:hypothetical protein
MAKAITEFQKLLQEKTLAASEEAEAKAARKYRERAAMGSCIICFDDKPNIATLCCGKAVHLNCIAEWLSANSSCPQCRGELPSLPPRMRSQGQTNTLGNHNHNNLRAILAGVNGLHNALRDMEAYSGNEESTSSIDGVSDEWDTTGAASAEDTTTADDSGDDDEPAVGVDATEDGTTSEDASATQVGSHVVAPAGDNTTSENDDVDTTDDTTDDASEEDTQLADQTSSVSSSTDVQDTRLELPPFCSHCTNRSAKDCSNDCCGRCCVLQGHLSCDRHNC